MVKTSKKALGHRGALLKGVLERVPAESFELVARAIKNILHRKSGIYALYKDDRVYYVGLAKRLHGRIRWHKKDKHSGKWNNFSVFIIEKVRYLKDIETLILHISQHKGNKTKGRIPEYHELKKILEDETGEHELKFRRLKRALHKI